MSGLLNILTESVTEVPRIEFPNLFDKSIIVNRVAFNLFGVDIYWYGVIIAVGVILAFIYAMHKCKQFGLIPDHVFDVAFVAIIFGFIGARAYYCIFIDTDINFFDLRHGGLAIYGGIIAAAIAAAITCVIHKVNLPAMFDVGGLGLLIGQCIGRWGNFVNQEAYGAPTAGSLPWGMTGTTIINDPVVIAKQAELDAAGNGLFALVHPCFLYESLWCLIGFIALHFYSKKLKTFDGEIFLLYIIWYGLGRFWIEALRTDSLFIGPFKVSQIVAGGCVIVGLALFILGKIFKTKKRGYVMYKDSEACKEKNEAYYARQKMLEEKEPLEIINTELVPALDIVGKGFEKGTMFLPQLLMSAEAAKAGFAAVKEFMEAKGSDQQKKGTVVIATVKGDIHDIGKNIVKVLLENYGYDVIDLGKDVPPETVAEKVVETHAPLLGLSALMTTTVVNMEETIRQVRKAAPWCKIVVGGAVLTKEYADMIGADYYGKDAMQTVYYAESLLNNGGAK